MVCSHVIVLWTRPSTADCQISLRDWVTESKELYWRNINYVKHTEAFIIEIFLNFDIPLLSFERSLISNFLAVVTGHGLFKVHLQKLKLAKESNCPKCGHDFDTAFHFLPTCQYYNTARKQTFGSSVLKAATLLWHRHKSIE